MKTSTLTATPNYGYYYFKPYMLMLLIFLILGSLLMLWGVHQELRFFFYLGSVICLYGIVTTIAWGLARYVIPGNRITIAHNIISMLGLSGKEKILDIGSGRGLYAIEAAKQLDNGKVVAIDVWDPSAVPHLKFQHKLSQPTGNSLNNAVHNAELSGVKNKIKFINMDANHLEFDADTFDIAICGFILGHLKKHRTHAIKEVFRILKPGGKLVLVDNVRDFVYFLLSTPHLFLLSLIRGTKACQLTRKKWLNDITETGFHIQEYTTQKGLIRLIAKKPNQTV
jgi:ubiquinone/menaquinone biosynthesis C-methylase UbiE